MLMTIETLALSRECIHEVDLAKLCRIGLDDVRDALSQFLTDGYIVFGVNDVGVTDLRFGSFRIIPFEREDGPEPGWLYGVSCSSPRAIKIGKSINPRSRLAGIKGSGFGERGGNGRPEYLLLGAASVKSATAEECMAHRHFANRRIRGEWFDIQWEELKPYLQKVGSYADGEVLR